MPSPIYPPAALEPPFIDNGMWLALLPVEVSPQLRKGLMQRTGLANSDCFNCACGITNMADVVADQWAVELLDCLGSVPRMDLSLPATEYFALMECVAIPLESVPHPLASLFDAIATILPQIEQWLLSGQPSLAGAGKSRQCCLGTLGQ